MKCNSVAFHTLGCRLNQSETASIQNSFKHSDINTVPINEPADIVVINTCTVTENGDADTRRLVNKVCRINPKTHIALVGCQAQVQKKELVKMPNVRWVVGNSRKMDFLAILRASKEGGDPEVIVPSTSKEPFTISHASTDTNHTRANIKIQDGCDFFCSFCEIPYARGRARSREFKDIIKEAKELVAAQHKELVITGINVGTYRNDHKSLFDVINELEQINGLERIRISSIEPTTIDFRIIEKMNKSAKLCRYLHIPLQSGSNKVLKDMRRKYTADEFSDFVSAAHKAVPEICIGTDVIVGFPGESMENFQESLNLLTSLPVHYFHVFSYSKRQLAKSKKLVDIVASQIIQKRSKQLRDLSKRKRNDFYRVLIGTHQRVLFEQRKEGHLTGVTDNYCRIVVDTNENLENQFWNIKIEGLGENALIGSIVN